MEHSEGSRAVFYVQPTLWASQPFPYQIEILWPRETQRTEQKGSHARKEKVPSFSFPLTNHTTNIPEFKVKGSFHQKPSETTFQFSELEECHFTGHLNILPSRKKFTILGNQRENSSVQIIFYKTTGLWQVWSEQTALLNAPLWCLDMLVRRRWIYFRLQRLCLNTQKVQPKKQSYTLN